MLRVLVVDDDPGTRDTYRVALRHEGYDVALADSRAAAVACLSRPEPFHAQFLDLNLPDGTGYDVLRWMRAERRFVPTLAMTAFRADFDPDEAIELGALAYVDQPLWLDDIIALARSLTRPPSERDDPNDLHARVVAGDPGALECLCVVLLKRLRPRLERAFPRLSWDLAEEEVSRACMEYAAGAALRFHPSTARSVVDFVYGIARRNLADRWRSESARKGRERRRAMARATVVRPDFDVPARDSFVRSLILSLVVNGREKRAAEEWLAGGTHEEIGVALGSGHLGVKGCRQAGKRFTDLMIKRASRYVRHSSVAE